MASDLVSDVVAYLKDHYGENAYDPDIEKRIHTVSLDGGYIRLMLKMMGITYVAQFAAEICKDAGYGAVGSQIELFGKVSILFVSMPVLLALLQTVGDFL